MAPYRSSSIIPVSRRLKVLFKSDKNPKVCPLSKVEFCFEMVYSRGIVLTCSIECCYAVLLPKKSCTDAGGLSGKSWVSSIMSGTAEVFNTFDVYVNLCAIQPVKHCFEHSLTPKNPLINLLAGCLLVGLRQISSRTRRLWLSVPAIVPT